MPIRQMNKTFQAVAEMCIRDRYIERAIEQGKYVISDSPMTLHPDKLKELFRKAVENNVVLVEKIMLVYLRAFNQLVWLTHGDLVGNVVSVKCAISQDDFEGGKSFNETVAHAICAIIKLLGKDCLEVNTNAVKDEDGNFLYDMITMKYPKALPTIEIGSTVDVEDELVIIGSKGRVTAVSYTHLDVYMRQFHCHAGFKCY